MVNVGVVGCGYWGPNYVRIFTGLKNSTVTCCCDLDEKNLDKIKHFYPSMKITKDYIDIATDPDIDSVVVTTPLTTHYEIAKSCLDNRKHVLIEKPFTSNSKEANELMTIAEEKKLVLMPGHVYNYHPGVRKLREILEKGELGDLYYISSERVGLGPIRKHASALWDLATHDICIAIYLLGLLPKEVTAEGESYIQKGVEDIVFLSLRFPKGIFCNMHATWIAPEKIRKTTVVGSKGMAVFDDVSKSEMIKIYEREVDRGLLDSTPEYVDHQSILRMGGIRIPKLEQSEPLKNLCEHFLDCVLNQKKPLTDARSGMEVVKVLEAAEAYLRRGR